MSRRAALWVSGFMVLAFALVVGSVALRPAFDAGQAAAPAAQQADTGVALDAGYDLAADEVPYVDDDRHDDDEHDKASGSHEKHDNKDKKDKQSKEQRHDDDDD